MALWEGWNLAGNLKVGKLKGVVDEIVERGGDAGLPAEARHRSAQGFDLQAAACLEVVAEAALAGRVLLAEEAEAAEEEARLRAEDEEHGNLPGDEYDAEDREEVQQKDEDNALGVFALFFAIIILGIVYFIDAAFIHGGTDNMKDGEHLWQL